MIKAECDRCALGVPVSGSRTLLPIGILVRAETDLPPGWSRITIPALAGGDARPELCPACLRALRAFLDPGAKPEPSRCVVCGHEASDHEGPHECTAGGSGECDCRLSPLECVDETWRAEADG